jgi:hypothetical protein
MIDHNRPPWAQPDGTSALSSIKPIPRYVQHDWDYCHRLIRGREVVIETVHKSLTSLTMEISVSRRRILRGEATRIECGPL